MDDVPEDDDTITFQKALETGSLKGMPTYRLPFHPRYVWHANYLSATNMQLLLTVLRGVAA